jgi:hypothetical protein
LAILSLIHSKNNFVSASVKFQYKTKQEPTILEPTTPAHLPIIHPTHYNYPKGATKTPYSVQQPKEKAM